MRSNKEFHHHGVSEDTEEDLLHRNLTDEIIGAAIEVHRITGPGLLESTYEFCLARELELRSIPFQRQVKLPIVYKDQELSEAYRLDILVDGKVIVEIKSVSMLEPLHEAQLLTYLKLSGHRVGLLLNFNTPMLKSGLRRLIN